jgi:hypothetical protein
MHGRTFVFEHDRCRLGLVVMPVNPARRSMRRVWALANSDRRQSLTTAQIGGA